MGINYSYAYKKFNREQEIKKKEYEKLGMSKSQIEQILAIDREIFLNDIRFWKHNQSLPLDEEYHNEEGRCSLIKKFPVTFTVCIENSINSKYWWIEEIEDERLVLGIKQLSDFEIELITLIIIEGYTQRCVAKMLGVSDMSISKRMKKITSKLKTSVLVNGGVENV